MPAKKKKTRHITILVKVKTSFQLLRGHLLKSTIPSPSVGTSHLKVGFNPALIWVPNIGWKIWANIYRFNGARMNWF